MKTGITKIIILALFYGGIIFAGTFLDDRKNSVQNISEDRIVLEKKYEELSFISIDRGLFSDSAFRQLLDQSVSIDKTFDKGRSNPFLPIGDEPEKIKEEKQQNNQTLSEILADGLKIQSIDDFIINQDLSGSSSDNQ